MSKFIIKCIKDKRLTNEFYEEYLTKITKMYEIIYKIVEHKYVRNFTKLDNFNKYLKVIGECNVIILNTHDDVSKKLFNYYYNKKNVIIYFTDFFTQGNAFYNIDMDKKYENDLFKTVVPIGHTLKDLEIEKLVYSNRILNFIDVDNIWYNRVYDAHEFFFIDPCQEQYFLTVLLENPMLRYFFNIDAN